MLNLQELEIYYFRLQVVSHRSKNFWLKNQLKKVEEVYGSSYISRKVGQELKKFASALAGKNYRKSGKYEFKK